jgi:hypothetical protein
MVWLKFYAKEMKMYEKEYGMKVSDKQAELIIRKLSRHFKISRPRVRFYGTRQSGMSYNGWSNSIRISHNPSVALVIHELAHTYNSQRHINHYHNRFLMRTIKKFHNYCSQFNYWINESGVEKSAVSASRFKLIAGTVTKEVLSAKQMYQSVMPLLKRYKSLSIQICSG